MENVYLNQLAKQGIFSVTDPLKQDADAPLSFLEWKQKRLNYQESDVYYFYQQYLLDWFENNKRVPITKSFVLRQKYLYLLQQLQAFFTDSEKQSWFDKINYANEKELLLSIPFFAKKLKNISLYYLKLRHKLKNAKIKYNNVGTSTAIEREVRTCLLELFSDLNTEVFPEIQNTLPSFNNLKNTIRVGVEELYDDNVYFDKSTTMPISSYYDLFHDATASFFRTKGLELSSSEWVFRSMDTTSLSSYETALTTLTSQIFEATDIISYQQFLEKFLGENRIETTFASLSTSTTVIEIPLTTGNNYFYYPYGIYDTTINNKTLVLETQLSSVQMPEDASAGETLETADTLFYRTGNLIKGAWLKRIDYETEPQYLRVKIKENGLTTFIYPFPGYGLSAENVEWTSYSLSATEEYQFLSSEFKAAVNERYWMGALPLDTCNSIYLNNTTLVEQGAYPDKNPNKADKIYFYAERPPADNIPYGNVDGAWLYYFDKTSTPIIGNTLEQVTYVWPIQYVSTTEDYPEYLSSFNFVDFCEPISIQTLNIPFAIAGDTFETADKIYKVARYNDNALDATECCWLSGSRTTNTKYSWINQNSFSALFNSGVSTSFVWSGPSETTISRLFGFLNHAVDCSFTTDTTTKEASACSCKQVYYSPYGHPGETFYEFGGNADYIIEDNYTTSFQPFDLESALQETTKFAWFKTNNKQAWGDGTWVFGIDGNKKPFTLQNGKRYTYRRSVNRKQEDFPSYVVNYQFTNLSEESKPKWKRAKKDSVGNWVSADTDSTLILNPGDFVKWDRQTTTISYELSTKLVQNEPESKGSIWSTYDVVPINSGQRSSTNLYWPFSVVLTDSPDPQIPTLPSGDAIAAADIENIIRWQFLNTTLQAENPNANAEYNVYDSSFVTFTPEVTGVYSITVEAIVRLSDSTVTTVIFSGIPSITAIPQYRNEPDEIEIEYTSSGYLLEQQLSGWKYSSTASGARPYWSRLYTDKTENTRFKGLYAWGYPNVYIEDYLPNFTPTISPLTLNYGNIVTYERRGLPFVWTNLLNYQTYVGTSMWYKLSSSTTSSSILSSVYEIRQNVDPVVYPLDEPCDIILTNYANGYPVEIFYNALNPFVWSVSATVPQVSSQIFQLTNLQASDPLQAISNRFYPTIATVPVAQAIYSESTYGGYFIPNYLGASQYINESFAAVLSGNFFNTTILTEDLTEHIGGRGFTKQDQPTNYTWTENNEWMKEPPASNVLAGSVKKDITKKYQTFVPYKTTTKENQLGLTLPTSKLSPWGGSKGSQWIDFENEPISYTGVRNVSAWNEDQLLKQNELDMHSWTTDVFGNQYGLYKFIPENTTNIEKKNITGELWVRTNKQQVLPASIALSGLWLFYNSPLLSGSNITEIECFYDVLVINTPSKLLFAKVNYDYKTSNFDFSFDQVRDNFDIQENSIIGQHWLKTNTKEIITPIVTLQNNLLTLKIHETSIPVLNSKEVYPNQQQLQQAALLTQSLSALNFFRLQNCSTFYNEETQALLITIGGFDTNNQPIVCDLIFETQGGYSLAKVETFKGQELPKLPVALQPTLYISTSATQVQTTLPATNSPTYYTLLNYNNIASLTDEGVLTFQTNRAGIYHLNYIVGNNAGSNKFGVSISVALPTPTPTMTRTPRPTTTPTISPTQTQTSTPTVTPTVTPTIPGPTATPGPSPTTSPTPAVSPSPTVSATASATPTVTPTKTTTATPTVTPTVTNTPEPTQTSTPSMTPEPTATTQPSLSIPGWPYIIQAATLEDEIYTGSIAGTTFSSLDQGDYIYMNEISVSGIVRYTVLANGSTPDDEFAVIQWNDDIQGLPAVPPDPETGSAGSPGKPHPIFGFRKAGTGNYTLGPQLTAQLIHNTTVNIKK